MLQRHPVLVYTVLRIGLFLLVGAVMAAAGARGWLLLVLAFLVSGLLSLILLDRPRQAVGGQVSGYFTRLNERIDTAARAEDDEEDAEVDVRGRNSAAADGPAPGTDGQPSDGRR